MNWSRFLPYLAVTALVTYLIRMLPLTLLRREIKSMFIRSFLNYIPYAVLAAMTFPAILYATSSPLSAAVGLVVALITAYFEWDLLPVALLSCAGVFAAEWLMRLL